MFGHRDNAMNRGAVEVIRPRLCAIAKIDNDRARFGWDIDPVAIRSERLKSAGVVLKKKCESAGIGVMAKSNITEVGQPISFIVRDGIADRIKVESNRASLARACEGTA